MWRRKIYDSIYGKGKFLLSMKCWDIKLIYTSKYSQKRAGGCSAFKAKTLSVQVETLSTCFFLNFFLKIYIYKRSIALRAFVLLERLDWIAGSFRLLLFSCYCGQTRPSVTPRITKNSGKSSIIVFSFLTPTVYTSNLIFLFFKIITSNLTSSHFESHLIL